MTRLFRSRQMRLRWVLAFGDALLVIASLVVSYQIVEWFGVRMVSAEDLTTKLSSAGWVFVLTHVTTLYVFGLYELEKPRLDWRAAAPLIFAVGAATILTSGVLFFLPPFTIGRQALLLHVPLLCGCLFAWRQLLTHRTSARRAPRRLAIAGPRDALTEFASELCGGEYPDFAITRAYVFPPSPETGEREPGLADIEWSTTLESFLGNRDYDALALDLHEFGDDEKLGKQLLDISFEGMPIHDLATLQKDLTGCYSTHGVRGSSILDAIATRVAPNRYYWRVKRLADLLIGGSLLLVLALPMLAIAALVRLGSRGPALFVQERLGKQRRPFGCMKFRTMATDAEELSGPTWAGEDDPRITRIGRVLRKTRLDELPQLLNVVRGEMTLVGPRPIRAFFADRLAEQIPFYDLRFAMKPGLTGWAQAHQTYVRSDEDQEAKFRYELYYLENFSLWLDLYTLIKTLRVVVARRGG